MQKVLGMRSVSQDVAMPMNVEAVDPDSAPPGYKRRYAFDKIMMR